MTTPNPVCSEAVFRLGGELLEISTESADSLDYFVEWLKTADDDRLDDYEPLDNVGGGANFELLEALIEARKQLGKGAFSKLPTDVAWKWEEKTIAVVVGKECHLPKSLEELYLALLREEREAEVAVVRPEAEEICRLFRRWKRGKMTKEQFKAKALALLLLEAGR